MIRSFPVRSDGDHGLLDVSIESHAGDETTMMVKSLANIIGTGEHWRALASSAGRVGESR